MELGLGISELPTIPYKDMHPGNLVPVSYIPCIPSCIATTISLEQVMREDKVNYLLLNSLVYMIFPGLYFTEKTSRRSHPR
jgi:hypothetical protein